MSRAAVSILAFGIYLFGGGLVLLLVPGALCDALGLEAPGEPWARISGMFFWILAYYCVRAALDEERSFMRWSLRTRPTTFVFLSAFVAFGLVRPVLLAFGVVDLAATLWTALALRKDNA